MVSCSDSHRLGAAASVDVHDLLLDSSQAVPTQLTRVEIPFHVPSLVTIRQFQYPEIIYCIN